MSFQATVKPTIFREYIGSKPHPGSFHEFPDIINPKIKEFHFIIAFAREKYDGEKGTGKFEQRWIAPNIDGQMIRDLKNKYEDESVNVKVVISIGGRGSKYPFNPVGEKTWLGNAMNSLIEIIGSLKDQDGNIVIDGIDINYDTIGDENVFANYIGGLIDGLKNDPHPLVSVVSIAPSEGVQAHYRRLYADHKNDIDWVNYQFYTHKITSADQFEQLYRRLARDPYTGHNLLAGFSTDPADAGNLPEKVFFEACRNLINNGELPGIFFWDANDSALKEHTFQLEQDAQNLLTQPHKTSE